MVCPRCLTAVENLLNEIHEQPAYVQLGEVMLSNSLNDKKLKQFAAGLQKLGFELLDDSRMQQIEKIKSIIINHIHHLEDDKFIFPEILAKELHKEYSQLSKLFSETEGITIEQYIIRQKIEKTKELLAYNEMNLSEIAHKLGYSSVAHLSAQFKKVTGLTTSGFRAQGIHLRKSLDNV